MGYISKRKLTGYMDADTPLEKDVMEMLAEKGRREERDIIYLTEEEEKPKTKIDMREARKGHIMYLLEELTKLLPPYIKADGNTTNEEKQTLLFQAYTLTELLETLKNLNFSYN